MVTFLAYVCMLYMANPEGSLCLGNPSLPRDASHHCTKPPSIVVSWQNIVLLSFTVHQCSTIAEITRFRDFISQTPHKGTSVPLVLWQTTLPKSWINLHQVVLRFLCISAGVTSGIMRQLSAHRHSAAAMHQAQQYEALDHHTNEY